MRSHVRSMFVAAAFAVAATACDADPEPLFEVQGTGSIEGLVFRDVDSDGRFDPAAGDSALEGIDVVLQERGTSSVIAGAEATTGANGRFELTDLPIGSHELAIDTAGTGERSLAFCQNPIPVSVFRSEIRFVAIDARGGCVITIAEAEALAIGSPVTVRGTITSALGMINTSTAFIEDATGGVALFRFVGGAPTFEVGDIVELSGTLDVFNAELEIVDVRVASIEPGDNPAALQLTTAEVAAAGTDNQDPNQGRLVRVAAAELLTPFAAGGGRNAEIDDGSGPTFVRIETGLSASTADINPRFTVNNCYNMIGILRSFNGTAQLTPRSYDDIQEVPCQP